MSIYLKKDFTNRVVLTLNEASNLSAPNYLFVFENKYNTSSVPVYFTTDDLSNSTCRYNLFEIIENVSGSTTGGTSVTISMMPGQYTYNVYESTASTLSISATTGAIIQTGMMTVDDTSTTDTYIDEVIPSQNNNSPSIYD